MKNQKGDLTIYNKKQQEIIEAAVSAIEKISEKSKHPVSVEIMKMEFDHGIEGMVIYILEGENLHELERRIEQEKHAYATGSGSVH